MIDTPCMVMVVHAEMFNLVTADDSITTSWVDITCNNIISV